MLLVVFCEYINDARTYECQKKKKTCPYKTHVYNISLPCSFMVIFNLMSAEYSDVHCLAHFHHLKSN